MHIKDKVYVAGHNGMVGSAIVRELKRLGYENIIMKSMQELDLRNQQAVDDFFCNEKPDYVFVAAAVVGGIWANMHGHARFLMENLQMQCNIIDSAYKNNNQTPKNFVFRTNFFFNKTYKCRDKQNQLNNYYWYGKH